MNSLKCNQITDLLSAYLENELDVTTSLQVANHLDSCSKCEKELNYLVKITDSIKSTIRHLDEKDLSIETRAKSINEKVKEQIVLAISKESKEKFVKEPLLSKLSNEVSSANPLTNNVVFLKNQAKKLEFRRKVLLSIAATLVMGFLSIFTITYYATATGPLLVGAARNHHFCSAIELSNIGFHKGYPTEQLLEAHNAKLPNLEGLGIKFLDLHPCKVYKTPFLHLMYNKGNNPISLYYGSKDAVVKFKEMYPKAVPEQLYLQESSNLQIGAISTSTNNIWLIAGELTKEEVSIVSAQLVTSPVEMQQSQLFH